jgi:hypothetical protein
MASSRRSLSDSGAGVSEGRIAAHVVRTFGSRSVGAVKVVAAVAVWSAGLLPMGATYVAWQGAEWQGAERQVMPSTSEAARGTTENLGRGIANEVGL